MRISKVSSQSSPSALTRSDGDAQPSRCQNILFTLKISSSSRRMFCIFLENAAILILILPSTVVNDVKIENNIGDAIVHRIIRAHRDGTPWKCCIMIPLLPGFTFPVDHSDASAVSTSLLGCVSRLTVTFRYASFWSVRTVPWVEGPILSSRGCIKKASTYVLPYVFALNLTIYIAR